MSSDRKTRASFVTLNHPESPEPEFAARLRAQMLGNAEPEIRPARVVPFRQSIAAPTPRRRHRWLDIAAAAVLLIGIISGLASLAPGNKSPGPATIRAPETGQPVMTGGSAAQDNQYPGPAPASSDYELRWTIGTVQDGYTGQAIAYGNVLYTIVVPRNEPLGSRLQAFDLSTGRSLWQQDIIVSTSFAVTPRGVVAFVPVVDAGTPVSNRESSSFQVALLDRLTGEPVWFSTEVYEIGSSLEGRPPIVTADGIYFADASGIVYALDLSTGQERWRYTYERALGAGLDWEVCFPHDERGEVCSARTSYEIKIAVAGETLYVSDMITGRITALSVADGAERWSIAMSDRSGSRTRHGALIAHDEGVVVQLLAADSTVTSGSSYLGLWAAEDGAEVWARDLDIPYQSIASSQSSLFVSHAPAGEACCALSALDARSGAWLWTKPMASSRIIGYLPSANMLVATVFSGSTAAVGIDVTTREDVWRFSHIQAECTPILPLADDGSLACWGFDSGLNVYQPAANEATSVAQDDRVFGSFQPPDAALAPRWDLPLFLERRLGGAVA